MLKTCKQFRDHLGDMHVCIIHLQCVLLCVVVCIGNGLNMTVFCW